MNSRARSQLALGIILVLAGAAFLLDRSVPQFHAFFSKYAAWPANLFLLGIVVLVLAIVLGRPRLAIPAAIVAGFGVIFQYEKTAGVHSLEYLWTLLPGFAGSGMILTGLMGENSGDNFKRGMSWVVASAVLYLIFASLFGGLKLLGNLGGAILLIALGLWVLGRAIYRSYRKPAP